MDWRGSRAVTCAKVINYEKEMLGVVLNDLRSLSLPKDELSRRQEDWMLLRQAKKRGATKSVHKKGLRVI